MDQAEKNATKNDKDIFTDLGINSTPERAIASHAIYGAHAPNLDIMLGKGSNEEETIELLKKNMRELMDDFTVHGMPDKDAKGNKILKLHSDFDGEACLALFRKAGFRTDKVKYVEQGAKPKSGWAADTGGVDGYAIEEAGLILIVDHHGAESKRDSSGARYLFNGLKDFGLFDKLDENQIEALENFVDFVTKEDNKDYTDEEIKKIFLNSHASLAGLRGYLKVDQVIDIFEERQKSEGKFNPFEALPPDYLKDIKFTDFKTKRPVSYKFIKAKSNASVRRSTESIQNIENSGFVIDTGTENHGKVLVDTCRFEKGKWVRKVGQGYMAAKAMGYDTYMVWNPEGNYFQLFTSKDMEFSFEQGQNMRGRYWLYAGEDPMRITFNEVLGKLSRKDDFQPDERLKKVFENDKIKKDFSVLIFEISKRKGGYEVSEKELREIVQDFIDELETYKKNTEAIVKKYKEEDQWPEEVVYNRVELHAQRLFLKVLSGSFGFQESDSEKIIAFAISNLKNKK